MPRSPSVSTTSSFGSLAVQSVSKAYESYSTEWDRILGWFGIAVRPKTQSEVLHDITFAVTPGEAIGIIGQNGSGKSTLLKIITGTLTPTSGAVRREGRVAALLELGLGFNGDFSGRQNASTYLSMIGCSHAQVTELMPLVESFAEIGDYFDQPVRTYSSGMQMRVAFAAATAFRPDILIVDEALAVGDSYFVHKCIQRIRAFCASGTTLLFVSHGAESVRMLCDRAILLDKGHLLVDGAPDAVCDYYNALIAAKANQSLNVEQVRRQDGWLKTVSGTGEVVLRSLQLLDADTGESIQLARVGQRLKMVGIAEVREDIEALVLGYMFRSKLGEIVWGTNTWHTKQQIIDLTAGEVVTFELYFACTLGPGSYAVSSALVSTETHLVNNFQWIDNELVFDVINADKPYFLGATYLDAKFVVDRA
jgi:lipopolysaccharide transport system ATP-binding protein